MSSRIITPGKLQGTVHIPASKSDGQRALLCAALAIGESRIAGLGSSDDEIAMRRIISDLGRKVQLQDDSCLISGSLNLNQSLELNAGESGLSCRLIAGVAAAFNVPVMVNGSGSLMRRSMDFWEDVFPKFGVAIETNCGKLPLHIKGPYREFNAEVDGSLSSQYISGLIMGLAFSGNGFRLTIRNLVSSAYLEMTIATLRKFGIDLQREDDTWFLDANTGYQSTNYSVEADWSSAAFWLVAAALGNDIIVAGLNRQSLQADVAILDALKQAGCQVSDFGDEICLQSSSLTAFEFDATNCPDLFPILAVLASQCKGRTVIKGVERLKNKESDRGEAIRTELGKMGVQVTLTQDQMSIGGPVSLSGAELYAHDDHRMAMSLAIASSIANSPSEINGSEHVAKSYPGFWTDFERMKKEVRSGF